jgi:hypothetical protein
MSSFLHRLSPRLVGAVAILIGLALLAWGVVLIRGVHDDATEVAWLRDHAPARSYRVAELGELDGAGHLGGVWVDVPGGPRAFIDLSRSDEQVHAVGDTLRAQVDEREAPALAEGLPADVVSSGVGSRYVAPGLLALGGLFVLVLGVGVGRSPRPRRRTEESVAAGRSAG